MSGRYPGGRGRWIRLSGGRWAYRRRGEAIPRVLGYTAFGASTRFAPRSRPRSRPRRSGASFGAGVAGSGGGSRVAPTQHFGTGSRAGYVPAELKVFRQWSDPSGVAPGPTLVPIDDSGFTLGLSEIEQGSSSEQRVGSGVKAQRLTCRYTIQSSAAGAGLAGVSTVLRILVLRAKNASGSLDSPTVGKVLEYTSSPYAQITSPLSHAGNGKYTVVDDHRVVLNPEGEPGSAMVFDRVLAVNRNIVFEEGSGGDEFVSGALYMLVISSVGAAAAEPDKPVLMVNTELSFTDV